MFALHSYKLLIDVDECSTLPYTLLLINLFFSFQCDVEYGADTSQLLLEIKGKLTQIAIKTINWYSFDTSVQVLEFFSIHETLGLNPVVNI